MLPKKSQVAESEGMAEVPVNGRVLAWARTIRGLSIDEAAGRLEMDPDILRAYESGAKKPLVGVLRLISQKYQINFTSLLMPEPLPPVQGPADHRTRANAKPLSMDSLIAIEEVSEALEVFEDIASENSRVIQKLRIGTATLDDDPEEVAIRERRRFGVSIDDQKHWRGTDGARRHWRALIEDKGVFTYMIPMPTDELSGFSIFRNDLAAICVNDRESTEGAKLFTLFHEYCHLLLRQAGISDENDNNRVEKFCNQFASSFLIPRSALKEAVAGATLPYEFTDYEVKTLATLFRVSNRAIALRLEKIGFAPSGFYARRTAPWDIPSEPKLVLKNPKDKGGPSAITLRIKRVGRLHAGTVLNAVERRAINSFDASELMGMKFASFGKIKAALG